MNHIVTSKQAILDVCRNLIREQGWAAINIRSVATACGVAVGSIYNYFPSKADLVRATVESVWRDIFEGPQDKPLRSVTDCITWIYDCMQAGGRKYPGFFTLHAVGFIGEEKTQGKQRMQQEWQHIQNGIHRVLLQDEAVRANAFDENFTREKFISLLFSMIMSALLRQDYDSSAVLEMVRRSIY